MGKGTSLFSGVSRFLNAVKSGSSLSPAIAKQDTFYSIIAWPDGFLALEQLCVLFLVMVPCPLCLGLLSSVQAERCTHVPCAFPDQVGSLTSPGFHPCLLRKHAVCSIPGQ